MEVELRMPRWHISGKTHKPKQSRKQSNRDATQHQPSRSIRISTGLSNPTKISTTSNTCSTTHNGLRDDDPATSCAVKSLGSGTFGFGMIDATKSKSTEQQKWRDSTTKTPELVASQSSLSFLTSTFGACTGVGGDFLKDSSAEGRVAQCRPNPTSTQTGLGARHCLARKEDHKNGDGDGDGGSSNQQQQQLQQQQLSASDKVVLLSKACKSHAAYIGNAAKGLGVDRHFLGLSLLVRDGETAPDLYSDPLFVRSKRWRVSTSNLTHPKLDGWGYGEVVPDGVGLSYSVHRDRVIFGITARKEHGGWPERLSQYLEDALVEMKLLVDEANNGGGNAKDAAPRSKL
mmetsp:Transcript_3379/g.9408  ORF Transcript_3379/g.9408 Transcript_3379/m.9408 type:complete len:345 (-) Transcript_3379:1077-2111(-)